LPPVDKLDEPKCSIRLLLQLLKKDGVNLTVLRETLKKRYGVGRAAIDSSRFSLIELGLIEEKLGTVGPNPAILTYLTPKGRAVAEKLKEIEELLEDT